MRESKTTAGVWFADADDRLSSKLCVALLDKTASGDDSDVRLQVYTEAKGLHSSPCIWVELRYPEALRLLANLAELVATLKHVEAEEGR